MILCDCQNTVHEPGCPNRGDGMFIVPGYPVAAGGTIGGGVTAVVGGTAGLLNRVLTTADAEWLIERIAQRVVQILGEKVDNRSDT